VSGGGLGLCRPDLEREEGDGASVADDGAHSPATEQVLVILLHQQRLYFSQCSVGFACFWASWILPSTSKNMKKNLDFYCFVTSLCPFIFEEWCKCTLKKE
jgi:hypothetical protein